MKNIHKTKIKRKTKKAKNNKQKQNKTKKNKKHLCCYTVSGVTY